jgi:GABA(A) receptor-associated protein
MQSYKDKYTLEMRQSESEKIIQKYPMKIPVIVEPYPMTETFLGKKKFIVPNVFTVTQFYMILRKRMTLTPEQALFVFFGGQSIVPMSVSIFSVYENFKDPDGFLYCKVTRENTFGDKNI